MKHQILSRGTADDGCHGYTQSGSNGRHKSGRTRPVAPVLCCFLLVSRSSKRGIVHRGRKTAEHFDIASNTPVGPALYNLCMGT